MTITEFENYLRYIYIKKDGSSLSERSIKHYSKETLDCLDAKFLSRISSNHYETIFDIDSLSELESLVEQIKQDPEFIDLDRRGKNMYSQGLNKYLDFARGLCFEGKCESEAFLDTPLPVKYKDHISERVIPERDKIKIIQLSKACHHHCEINPSHQTFLVRKSDYYYTEGHHLIPLSQQACFSNSLDCYANLIILCPTCHKLLHYGRETEIEKTLHPIYEERADRYKNSGLSITWPEFRELAIRTEPSCKLKKPL